MGRQAPVKRPVGQEFPFHFDVCSCQAFRAEPIVGKKRKAAEAESR
jgi:hypothetical protein